MRRHVGAHPARIDAGETIDNPFAVAERRWSNSLQQNLADCGVPPHAGATRSTSTASNSRGGTHAADLTPSIRKRANG
jgi:hypothetical protein